MAAIEAIRRIHSSQPGRVDPAPPRPSPRDRRMPNLERPRPAGPVLTVAAVIGVGAVLALAVSRLATGPGSHRGRPATTVSASSPAARAGARPTTAARSRPGHATGTSSHRGHPPTTTTLPTGPLAPTSVGPGGATYLLGGAGTLTVEVATGTGACWLEVGAGPGGPFQFSRTLAAGSTQAFTGTGQLWLRLGAPGGVTVTADGRRLLFSADPAQPFNLMVKRSTMS